jgi:hypothetical protein
LDLSIAAIFFTATNGKIIPYTFTINKSMGKFLFKNENQYYSTYLLLEHFSPLLAISAQEYVQLKV